LRVIVVWTKQGWPVCPALRRQHRLGMLLFVLSMRAALCTRRRPLHDLRLFLAYRSLPLVPALILASPLLLFVSVFVCTRIYIGRVPDMLEEAERAPAISGFPRLLHCILLFA